MNPENTKYLFEKYPILYAGKDKSIRENLMRFGFEHGDGWFHLIDVLSSLLEHTNNDIKEKKIWAKDKVSVEAVQVKEKFGILRFYVNQYNDYGTIDFVEHLSEFICEGCGKFDNKSKLKDYGYWIHNCCDECWEKLKEKNGWK